MKVNLDFKQKKVFITKEDNDKPIYDESVLFYRIKRVLLKQGFNVVKKLMVKDNHLTDDNRYYIRERNWKWCILDNYHSIRFTHTPFNEGSLTLEIVELDIS